MNCSFWWSQFICSNYLKMINDTPQVMWMAWLWPHHSSKLIQAPFATARIVTRSICRPPRQNIWSGDANISKGSQRFWVDSDPAFNIYTIFELTIFGNISCIYIYIYSIQTLTSMAILFISRKRDIQRTLLWIVFSVNIYTPTPVRRCHLDPGTCMWTSVVRPSVQTCMWRRYYYVAMAMPLNDSTLYY